MESESQERYQRDWRTKRSGIPNRLDQAPEQILAGIDAYKQLKREQMVAFCETFLCAAFPEALNLSQAQAMLAGVLLGASIARGGKVKGLEMRGKDREAAGFPGNEPL